MASNKAKRRAFNPLSLSFLDVMSCGFGAVVLLYLILDHASTVIATEGDPSVAGEVTLLEEEILQGQLGLVEIRNTLSEVDFDIVTAEGRASRIQEQIQDFLQELAALENSSVATVESVEQLRADVRALEEELLRLQAASLQQEGNNVRQFLGDGNRQYLSGMYLGGSRILILMDSSTSMLDDSLVNIIRTRNMSTSAKLAAPKWQQVVKTVDWITTQLPITSQYQIINFSSEAQAVVEGTDGQWLEVADRDQLDGAIDTVKQLVPANGTNLEQVIEIVSTMDPLPDNIFLITDGLPTLSNSRSNRNLVTPSQRMELFEDAVERLPRGIPVNVILLPLEGDPSAAAAYWLLAQNTRGSFLTPSRDWP